MSKDKKDLIKNVAEEQWSPTIREWVVAVLSLIFVIVFITAIVSWNNNALSGQEGTFSQFWDHLCQTEWTAPWEGVLEVFGF